MSRITSKELEPLVGHFEHLSDKRRADEALTILRKVASLVKPLMRQRSWHVETLAEFYPSESNLLGLNINRGQKICLRLRYPGDETQFLPMENIVDTMLHELAHNVHGPHNQHFHALWDKLRDEHEALIRKGYTGEGFLGQGNRLGGRKMPASELRRQARAAAEKRKNMVGGGPRRLGGTGILRGQDPRAVIAAAAEKRLKIERGCASTMDQERQKAQEEMKNDKVTTTTVEQENEEDVALLQAYIDMIQEEEQQLLGKNYVPASESNPAGARATISPPGLRTSMLQPKNFKNLVEEQKQIEKNLQNNRELDTSKDLPSSLLQPKPEQSKQTPPRRPLNPNSQPQRQEQMKPQSLSQPTPQSQLSDQIPDTWTCEICTLVNPMQFLACDACTTERPEIYAKLLSEASELPSRTSHNTYSTTSTSSASSRKTRDTPNALKPRLNAVDSAKRIEAQSAYKLSQPVGWKCRCGNFMEQQWWTCSVCGRMKETS